MRIGLEHPTSGLRYFLARLNNECRLAWDNEPAFRYGYRPASRAEDYAASGACSAEGVPVDPIGDSCYQGGSFCSAEFDGDTDLAGT